MSCQVSTSDTTDGIESIGDPEDPAPELDEDVVDDYVGDTTCDVDEEPPPFEGCDDGDESCGSGQSPSGQHKKPPPGYSQMTRDQQCFEEPGFSYTAGWYNNVASDGWCEACGGSPAGSAWSSWNKTGDKVCQGTGVALTSTEQKCVCTALQPTQAGLHLPAVIATAYLMNQLRLSLKLGRAVQPILAIEVALKKAIKGFGLSILKCQELASALCADYAPGSLKKHCLELTFAICNNCKNQ